MTQDVPARGPKFRRRADARPDEVLDAALALFIEKGFAATRVEDIAQRAGISKGAVYLYFPSKEAVLEGIVRRAVTPIADRASGLFETFAGDPRRGISMALGLLAQRLNDPSLAAIPRLIVREVPNFPELATMYRREVLDRMMPVLEGLIQRGIEMGQFRPVDPALTVRTIIGPVIAHMLMAVLFGIMPGGGLHMDRLVENHLTILFDGLSSREAANA